LLRRFLFKLFTRRELLAAALVVEQAAHRAVARAQADLARRRVAVLIPPRALEAAQVSLRAVDRPQRAVDPARWDQAQPIAQSAVRKVL